MALNPFTRYLRSQHPDDASDFDAFVTHWDALESLIINTYRSGVVDTETEEAYTQLRSWLAAHYPRWATSLAPLWQAAREAGGAPPSDPFARLIAPESATHFIGNRHAMQALPPAREAINRYLLARR